MTELLLLEFFPAALFDASPPGAIPNPDTAHRQPDCLLSLVPGFSRSSEALMILSDDQVPSIALDALRAVSKCILPPY